MNHRYHPETEKHHPSNPPFVLHFGHIVGLSVFQNLGDTHAKDSLEKERLPGKFTAEPKPPSNAVADAPRRGAAKGGGSLERKLPDPRTPSFERCAVIC
jgi:hypothetical protein